MSLFNPGDLVRLKSTPSTQGAVIACQTGPAEDRYQVFHDGKVHTYYASQLEPVEAAAPPPAVPPATLHAALTALQLNHPGTSHLYSLRASRINFVPYQFRPVLKLIQSDRPRLLIADEVGVGKTIEAGLILKELQARREIRSVLIICPKPLVAERKWQQEMNRFDEKFEHLDSAALRYCLDETDKDGVWPKKRDRVILPFSLCDKALLEGTQQGRKKRLGLKDLIPPPSFDLVIVDEAHHIRNTATQAHQVVKYFCDNAEAAIFLSATPIQLGNQDLFNLLSLLRPEDFFIKKDNESTGTKIDMSFGRKVFQQMSEPNPHINAAIESARAAQSGWQAAVRTNLDQALGTAWGRGVLANDPRTQIIEAELASETDTAEKRLALIRQLESLYTFAPFINRTRRRDIGNAFTKRNAHTIPVEFTAEQAALHDELLDLIRRMLAHRHGDKPLEFLLSMVRRQLASCVYGLAPLLEKMLNNQLKKLQENEAGDEEIPENTATTLVEFRADVDRLIRQAKAISGADTKLDALLKVIDDKQKLGNNKLLLFSSFRHTLAYLMERFKKTPIRFGLIHGDIPDDERRALRNRFSLPKENPDALDLLLSSEVGCEGLDYQFCDGLINYDLPWNPMRVEQRIGRIDRYGQKSEAVAIYNFITPGTVDANIYERCLLRIGVFEQALGGSEDILGEITAQLRNIAEDLTLTETQVAERLQQLADNQIRAIQEQAKLEEQQATLFGLKVDADESTAALRQADSFWLSPERIANLVERYLTGFDASKTLPNKPIINLQFGKELREILLKDYQKLNMSGAAAVVWEHWLKGNDAYLKFTFDQATADEQRDLFFITPTHPLTRQAAKASATKTRLRCTLTAHNPAIPAGRYPFAIYSWRKLGLKEDFTFHPVCTDALIAERMLELLEIAAEHTGSEFVSEAEEHALEHLHQQQWSKQRDEHQTQVRQLAEARLASLETTHQARIALLQQQRNVVNDISLHRMRDSQIESAKRDYERRNEELRAAAQRGDILAEAVVFGILNVETM